MSIVECSPREGQRKETDVAQHKLKQNSQTAANPKPQANLRIQDVVIRQHGNNDAGLSSQLPYIPHRRRSLSNVWWRVDSVLTGSEKHRWINF